MILLMSTRKYEQAENDRTRYERVFRLKITVASTQPIARRGDTLARKFTHLHAITVSSSLKLAASCGYFLCSKCMQVNRTLAAGLHTYMLARCAIHGTN